MEAQIVTLLLTYGPLGVFTLVALLVARQKDKELTAERQRHADEMAAFQERYVSKVETWASKNQEMLSSTNTLLEALTRKFGGSR